MSDAKQNASPYYTKGRVLKSAIAELIDDYEALKREANELRGHNKYLESRVSEESDYAELETRHNALVEAVEWEMECEDVAQWRYEVWEMAEVGSGDCEIYTVAQCIHDEARSEVERLIANEGAADCKGEG